MTGSHPLGARLGLGLLVAASLCALLWFAQGSAPEASDAAAPLEARPPSRWRQR